MLPWVARGSHVSQYALVLENAVRACLILALKKFPFTPDWSGNDDAQEEAQLFLSMQSNIEYARVVQC